MKLRKPKSARKKHNRPKRKASDACSRYVRLRDAIAYCKIRGIDIGQFTRVENIPVKCCTCNMVKSWINVHAGHFIGRSLGGGSGVYFDERNIHAQCPQCNAFRQGNPLVYKEFMLQKYGQKVIDELRVKHTSYQDSGAVAMQVMEILYKELFDKLVADLERE